MNDDRSLKAILEFAVDAAWQAGKITTEYFQTPITPDIKADSSPVTIADRRAEESLRAAIERRYPDHAILGEEYGATGPDGASYRWILDPIDGTASFVRGVPLYGVMMGLERDGEMVLGVVNLPALGEIVYAAKGEGAFWNGRRARVSSVDSLDEALFSTTDPGLMHQFGRTREFERLCQATRIQRMWGDCYGHMLVATGRIEIMADPIMNIWDNAALMPILEEAGGSFTDWAGNRTHTASDALSTNGVLHERVLAEMAASRGE